jgi:hypothetical protein
MHSRKELVAGGAIFIESLAQGLERGSLLGFVVPHPFLQQSDEGNRVVQPRCGWGIWNSRELESSLVGSGISLPRLYNAGVIDPTKVTRTALQRRVDRFADVDHRSDINAFPPPPRRAASPDWSVGAD